MAALSSRAPADHASHLHPSAAAALAGRAEEERVFVACVVRLSIEKNPVRFAAMLEKTRGELRKRGLIPLLCGAAADATYADEVRRGVKAAASHSPRSPTYAAFPDLASFPGRCAGGSRPRYRSR